MMFPASLGPLHGLKGWSSAIPGRSWVALLGRVVTDPTTRSLGSELQNIDQFFKKLKNWENWGVDANSLFQMYLPVWIPSIWGSLYITGTRIPRYLQSGWVLSMRQLDLLKTELVAADWAHFPKSKSVFGFGQSQRLKDYCTTPRHRLRLTTW